MLSKLSLLAKQKACYRLSMSKQCIHVHLLQTNCGDRITVPLDTDEAGMHALKCLTNKASRDEEVTPVKKKTANAC